MKKLINFVIENKKMVLCASTTVVALIAVIVSASLLMKGDNETITDSTTASYSTTMPTSTASPTIPPIEVNKTASAEPENTSSIEPGKTSGGLEVTVQGGTTSVGSNNNNVKSPAVTKSPSSAATSATKKPAAPTATVAKPTTSISIVTNSPKPSVTKTPTPTSTVNYEIDSSEYAVEAIKAAVEYCKINDTVDYRTVDNGYREKMLYYIPCFIGNDEGVDNWITEVKNNTIVSESYFVPDSKTSAKVDGAKYIISGSYYIKFGSQTKASYLKNEGVSANKWYSKKVNICMGHYGSQGLWEHGTYTRGYIETLSNWQEVK